MSESTESKEFDCAESFWAESDVSSGSAREVRPADARLVGGALLIGAAFDLAVRRPAASVAVALFLLAIAATLLQSGRLVTRHSRALVAVAPLFGAWVMVRSSPWLVPLDLLAALLLLIAGMTTSNQRSLLSLTVRDVLGQPLDWVTDAAGSLRFLRRGLPSRASSRVRPFATGFALMLPIVAILSALLASGDALTGAVLGSIGASGLFGHLLTAGFGAWLGVVILFRASAIDREEPRNVDPWLGCTEATVVLAGMTVLYAAFVALQVAGALGAADHILNDAAATSDWARSGFFQLLWTAAITLVILLSLDRITLSTPRRWYRGLTMATASLTVVIVAISVFRIAAYSNTFGLTMLRLYAGLFALWVGGVFVLFMARASQGSERWLGIGAAGLGLTILFGLNVANPEVIVVRYDTGSAERVDVAYLTNNLSVDAIPSLAASVDLLDQPQRDDLETVLCGLRLPPQDGWLSWNRSRSQARRALLDLCGSR